MGSKERKENGSKERPRPKTGIHFYPPKQTSTHLASDQKHLPYNYARLQERERELLLTTLSEQNRQLKEEERRKDGDYQKLEKAYKLILQEKAHQAVSVREVTLQKQLASLQGRHDKLQHLCKLEREKNQFKVSRVNASQGFIAADMADQR